MELKRNPFKQRERFLILEISPKRTKGLFLSVDEDRTLIFEKAADPMDLKKFLDSPVQKILQKSWEGQRLFKFRRKVIVAADPSIATTIPIPLDLARDRERQKEEVTVAELENLIAQAMQKVFTGCRNEAAHRLGIDDIHTILVGAKTKYFKVDGRSVMNPAGFTGRKISLLLELTFTGRELFESLKEFFSAPETFFFVEAPQARLASLSRVRKLPVNLVAAGKDASSLFVFQKAKGDHPVLYREKLDWSFGSLAKAISKELGVSERAARELYRVYIKEGMSESAARAFKKALEPAVAEFLEEIEKAKIEGSVYVDAPDDLPFVVPYRHGAATIDRAPVAEVLAQFGFGDNMPDARFASGPLLYFLEAYFDKSNSEINQKLRRRLHWLAE